MATEIPVASPDTVYDQIADIVGISRGGRRRYAARSEEVLRTLFAVITESMYLVAFSRRAQDGLLEMIQRGAVAIAPLTGQDVPRVRALMGKYRDTPMDFADATLVRVAEREKIANVFTLDKDFVVYRVGRGHTFSVKP